MEISSLNLKTPSQLSTHSQEAFIFPDVGASPNEEDENVLTPASLTSELSCKPAEDVTDLEASTSTLSTHPASGEMTPRAPPSPSQPSGLSVLLARYDERSRKPPTTPITDSATPTPTLERSTYMGAPMSIVRESRSASPTSEELSHALPGGHHDTSNESVPLLSDLEANHPTYHTNGHAEPEPIGKRGARGTVKDITLRISKGSGPVLKDGLKSIPAVILGTLLNILDGVSCTSGTLYRTREVQLTFF